ncbi:unnamed protein product [Prorocentrum cordatum]|nr:unnamed protein product [Polarella glacialis]
MSCRSGHDAVLGEPVGQTLQAQRVDHEVAHVGSHVPVPAQTAAPVKSATDVKMSEVEKENEVVAGGGGARAAGRSGGGVSVDIAELLRSQFSAMKQDMQQRLQLGIESSEEDDSQQEGPQSSTSRSALTRSGKKHRKRRR